MTSGYQILGSLSWSIHYVDFPPLFSGMIDRLNSVTLFDFATAMPTACVDHDVNDHRRLLFQTLVPIMVAFTSFVGVRMMAARSSHAVRERLQHGFAYGLLLMGYILLPTTSNAIFNMFNCNDCESYCLGVNQSIVRLITCVLYPTSRSGSWQLSSH